MKEKVLTTELLLENPAPGNLAASPFYDLVGKDCMMAEIYVASFLHGY